MNDAVQIQSRYSTDEYSPDAVTPFDDSPAKVQRGPETGYVKLYKTLTPFYSKCYKCYLKPAAKTPRAKFLHILKFSRKRQKAIEFTKFWQTWMKPYADCLRK